jgi:hypothetical protein
MITENDSPNITAHASGDQRSDAYVNGYIPITVVSVVSKIGRSLETDASTTDFCIV